jgi:hypothetical protein
MKNTIKLTTDLSRVSGDINRTGTTFLLAGVIVLAIIALSCTKQSKPQTSSKSGTTAIQTENKSTATQTSSEFEMNGTTLVKYNGNGGSVTIPSSVTVIGDMAFYGNKSLTSVTIPSSVTTIGSDAFMDCSSLTSVDIPSSVLEIWGNAFRGTKLTEVILSPETYFTETWLSENMPPTFDNGVQINYRE